MPKEDSYMKEFVEDARAAVIELQRGLIERLREEVKELKHRLGEDVKRES